MIARIAITAHIPAVATLVNIVRVANIVMIARIAAAASVVRVCLTVTTKHRADTFNMPIMFKSIMSLFGGHASKPSRGGPAGIVREGGFIIFPDANDSLAANIMNGVLTTYQKVDKPCK